MLQLILNITGRTGRSRWLIVLCRRMCRPRWFLRVRPVAPILEGKGLWFHPEKWEWFPPARFLCWSMWKLWTPLWSVQNLANF